MYVAGFASDLEYVSDTGQQRLRQTSPLYLFVNGRPVENAALRRRLQATYASCGSALSSLSASGGGGIGVASTSTSASAAAWFVMLSVSFPPDALDVNVHPAKSTVRCLHEDRLLDTIELTLRAKLQERTAQGVHMNIRCV